MLFQRSVTSIFSPLATVNLDHSSRRRGQQARPRTTASALRNRKAENHWRPSRRSYDFEENDMNGGFLVRVLNCAGGDYDDSSPYSVILAPPTQDLVRHPLNRS